MVWRVKDALLQGTFSGPHADDPVWGVAADKGGEVYTCCGGGRVIRWEDRSEEVREEEKRKEEDGVLKGQQLAILMYKKEYVEAARMAVRVDRPRECLRALEEVS